MMEDRFTVLSDDDRQSLMWKTTTSRRKTIPTFSTSLSRVDTRERRCATCKRAFMNLTDLKKHVALTHTGMKPVACEICGKRFELESHMLAHYELHKEPRLQEFAILTKRRKVKSEPPASPSQTTVGSFHGVPRHFKHENLPETWSSFGTKQTFHVSHMEKKRDFEQDARDDNKKSCSIPSISAHSKKIHNLSDLDGTNRKHHSSEMGSSNVNRGLPNVASQNLPRIDPGRISVIDSVTGVNAMIETSKKSQFIENSEERFMRKRMREVELAGNPSRQNSRQTGSGSLGRNVDSSRQRALTRLSSGYTIGSRGENLNDNRHSNTRLNSRETNFMGR